MKLSDFNVGMPDQGLSPAIKDFNNPKPQVSGTNDGTINNLAAHVSALGTPETLLQTYSQITNELKSGSSSLTLEDMLKKQNEFDYSANLSALRDVLADPNITDDDKARYTQGFANMTAEPLGSRSVGIAVGRMAQMADSDPINDNDETEWVRYNGTAALDEVDAYNGWVQSVKNAQEKISDPSAMAKLTDLIEIIIPFMEGAAVGEVKNALGGGDPAGVMQALVFLGEGKDAIVKAVNKLPFAERRVFAEKLVEYVKAGKGSISIRPNDTLILNQLNDYLVTGAYGGEQRFLDNLFSVIDFGFVLAPFKLMKGVKAISSTRALQRAEAANARLAKVAPEVDEIIETVAPIPVTPLDNIVNGITGFDKATSEEIADARNTIGYGLEEGLDVEEIISNTKAFDKFTADEINQARQVISTPSAHTNPPLAESVVEETGNLISDKIINNLEELDEKPYQVYQDIRNAVKGEVTNVALTNPKVLSRTVMKKVNDVLTQHGITAIKGDTLKGVRKHIELQSAVSRRSVRTDVAPTSLSQTLKGTNPGKARGTFKAVEASTDDTLAEVVYGTNRTEAIANDVLPEVKEMDGAVRHKVEMDGEGPSPNQSVVSNYRASRGWIELSDYERSARRNTVIQDFKNVVGLTPRRAMASVGDGFKNTDSGVSVDLVYGPTDSGFRSPKEAMQNAKLAFAKYGLDEREIELVSRRGNGDYGPAEVSNLQDGDYLIRVKYDYEFSPSDTLAWTLTSTNRFWRLFDMVLPFERGGQGGLAQQIIPHFNIQDNLLYAPASVMADRSAKLRDDFLDLTDSYVKSRKGLDKRQQSLVDSYIIEANNLSLPFNQVNLAARGMDEKAIETLRLWKGVNDTLYHFENVDLNKTLRARGYWQFVDSINNTSFVVKPIGPVKLTGEYDVSKAMSSVFRTLGSDKVKVYDSRLDEVVTLEKADITKLYENGGQLGKTRRSIDSGEDSFEYVIVRGNEEGYIRRLRDDDKTLNYRDGHYTVYYKQPYFITKKIRVDGKEVEKAVATAGSIADAERLRDSLRLKDEAGEYGVRGDKKVGSTEYEDFQWDTMVSGGRTSQRVRGNRLVNASGQQTDLNHLHIEGPEESLIHSISSLSRRVSHRDFLDAAKARFMNQFKDLLETDKGLEQWPTSVGMIGKGDPTISRSRIKDAVNTWRFIEAIDSGYVNLIDDTSKLLFKNLSATAGRNSKHWGWLEGPATAASRVNPTAYGRKKAFRFLLAANPARSLLVQSMQALPTVAGLNPKMILTGRLPAQILLINYLNRGGDVESFLKAGARLATGLSLEDAKKLIKDYELSGFESAVNAMSLIRDDMKRLVDRSIGGKVKSIAAAPINVMQKAGFNFGENLLMRSVWLSEYDLLRQAKVEVTPLVLEKLNARVRNLTGNMNSGGEMPWNENSLSIIMQFFQAPYKAFWSTLVGHTGLDWKDRAKLGTAYVLTYGVGPGIVLDFITDKIPMDEETRKLVKGGFFNLLLNKALSTLYGEEVNTDFSDSFRLLQAPDLVKFWGTLMETGVAGVIGSTPAGSLVFGDNPRLTDFVKQLVMPFTAPEEQKGQEWENTATMFLSIMSGGSNYFKAKYAWEKGKAKSASGVITDFNVNSMEAVWKAGGFITEDEAAHYAFNEKSYKLSEDYKKDISEFITGFSKHLSVEGISNDETAYWLRMMQQAQLVWGDDPFYMKEIVSQLAYRHTRGDHSYFDAILRLSGYVDEASLKNLISSGPMKPEEKDELTKMIEVIKGTQ